MPISTELIANVDELRSEAGQFEEHARSFQNLTTELFDTVDSTLGVWRGEAQSAYTQQFNSLRNSMDMLFQQIQEYHDDLIDIVNNYEQGETKNTEGSRQLAAEFDIVD